MSILDQNIGAIHELCKQYKVKSLYAFGSILTDRFNEESDVDLLVNFKAIDLMDYADNYFDLKYALQNILKHPVDLIEAQAVKNPFFLNSINKQRQLVYG